MKDELCRTFPSSFCPHPSTFLSHRRFPMQPAIPSELQFPPEILDQIYARLFGEPRATYRAVASWLRQLGYEIAPSTVGEMKRRREDDFVPKGPPPARAKAPAPLPVVVADVSVPIEAIAPLAEATAA